MTADDLSTPLGHKRKRKWLSYRLPFSTAQAIAGLLGLFLLAFVGFALFGHGPLGGEPSTTVAIDAAMLPAGGNAAPQAPGGASHNGVTVGSAKPARPPAHEERTVTIIDGSSGKRQEIVIPGQAGKAAGPSIPATPEQRSDLDEGINPALLETSRYGSIPVISKDGLKPLQAYARPVDSAALGKAPLIAIVVTGLGRSAEQSRDAIDRLPGAVTLGLTPYGSSPRALAAAARKAGHEILLQVPMEPFDYPDNDPGPRTLMGSYAPEQNLDRLGWHMSQMQGYVGLTPFMGSKFVNSSLALAPLMKDLSRRGLLWLDDGSAPRSMAESAAMAQAIPFAKASLTIDAVTTPNEIDRALSRLEAVARERGVAIGVASALPVSIDRIERWAKSLDTKGLILVPLTAAARRAQSG